MNCQHFESIMGDFARGLPLEARAREEAGAHEEGCARCAARLADERALSAGLRGMAASDRDAEAPPRVEAALLAAFRAQAAAQKPAEREASGKVVPLARPSALRRWSWAKTAAASAAAAAAVVAVFMLAAPRRPAPDGMANSRPAPSGERTQTKATLTNTPPSPAGDRPDGPGQEVAEVVPPAPQPSRVPPARNASRASSPASYRAAARPAPRDAGRFVGDEEIATDFIPLTQDARFAVAEGGGQVVRVELPRTALQRFGLPMNVEHPGGRVKADLMLGYDGIPRAIRFVR